VSVTLYIGNTPADLARETVIALTLQVHDLTNLESRDGNYSNSIKLPLTSLNKGLLGFANDVNSYSDIPYTRIAAQLHVNGIVQSGFLQLDGVDGDFANVVFFSGNSGFFEAMGDKKLNDLDLSDFDSYWNIVGTTPNTFSTKNNTSGVVWGIVEYGTDEVYRTLTNALIVNPKTLRPCLYVHSIMQKILELTGFEMQGDFMTDNRYLTEIVPIVSNEPKHSDAWNAGQTFSGTLNTPITTHLDPSQTAIVTYSLDDTLDPGNNFTSFYYRFPASGLYSADVSVDLLNTTGRPVSALVELVYRDNPSNNVSIIQSETVTLPDTTTNILLQPNIDCLAGNDLYTVITFTNLSGIDDENVESNIVFEVFNITDTIISYTNLFEINGNMPEMTLKEFVKSLAQRYNLLFKADVVSQVITVLTYDEVYNATPLDWTDRLDVGGKKIDFHPAFFGQNNQFRWADETNNPVDYANGQLLISDEILSKAIVTIQQPFAASLDVIRFDNVSVSQIPLLEYDEISVSSGDAPAIAAANQVIIYNVTPNILNTLGFQTSAVYKLTTVKPRLLYVDLTVMSDELVYDDGTNTAQDANAEPLTWFWNDSAYNLTFVDNENGLIDNYISLAFSFGRFKKLTVLMNLTAIDALTFAFDRTITINPYGRFYVNKINNYQPNQLTEVELIKV
jgi:hypothetical protein